MRRASALGVIAALAVSACGGSPSQPSVPAAARLTVSIDSKGSTVAISGYSQVSFDASASSGTNLQYSLDYGDGSPPGTEPVTRHVYMTPGIYTATVTVTGRSGVQAKAIQTVTVRSIIASWSHVAFNDRSRQLEVRRISITSQQGAELRGVYAFYGLADRAFGGRLSGDRDIRIALDDGSAVLEGTLPGTVNQDGTTIALRVQGGSADGQTLDFAPAGEPTAPPPRAALSLNSSSGSNAIMGFDVSVDASASTGERLVYGIDFGDGEFGSAPSATHAFLREGPTTVRVTVADRFGRVDTTSRNLAVQSLRTFNGFWYHSFFNPNAKRSEYRTLTITSHQGRTLSGWYAHPEGWTSSLSGSVSGTQDVKMFLNDGTIDFTGPYRTDSAGPVLDLRIRGGSADGFTLPFRLYGGY